MTSKQAAKAGSMGIIGLGVMGRALARNCVSKGFKVSAYDSSETTVEMARGNPENESIEIFSDLVDFIDSLEKPRRILLLVPEDSVDTVLEKLAVHLKQGDAIADCGNSFYLETAKRNDIFSKKGIFFLGAGISGGEEGALRGCSVMAGGQTEAWDLFSDIFSSISARTPDDEPCAGWMGHGGAGHLVKMCHNGIEYAVMQLTGEIFFLLRSMGLDHNEIANTFNRWNKTCLKGYLTEITACILAKTDSRTGKPLVDMILDCAGQKGTGSWTVKTAAELGVSAPTISEAVFARALSSDRELRLKAAAILEAPKKEAVSQCSIESLENALYSSIICVYAQGLELMRAASIQYSWNIDIGKAVSVWREGSILRSGIVYETSDLLSKEGYNGNILLQPVFSERLNSFQRSWRETSVQAITSGVYAPCILSALAYYDGIRSGVLPACLIQAQRDFFGSHTYERIDCPRGEYHHTLWNETDNNRIR